MNIDKIEIKTGQYVWVDNEAKIKEGDYCYHLEMNDGKIDRCYDVTLYHTWTNNGVDKTRKFFKIIAASFELGLEEVPTYVEWLSYQNYPFNPELTLATAFIKGYQTAKLELFTKEDVIFAIQEAYGHGQNDEFDGLNKIEESIKSIIEYLKKEKLK